MYLFVDACWEPIHTSFALYMCIYGLLVFQLVYFLSIKFLTFDKKKRERDRDSSQERETPSVVREVVSKSCLCSSLIVHHSSSLVTVLCSLVFFLRSLWQNQRPNLHFFVPPRVISGFKQTAIRMPRARLWFSLEAAHWFNVALFLLLWPPLHQERRLHLLISQVQLGFRPNTRIEPCKKKRFSCSITSSSLFWWSQRQLLWQFQGKPLSYRTSGKV